MSHPPRITDEPVLVRWMGLEIAKMTREWLHNESLLLSCSRKRIPLSITKKGDTYHFDPSVIATLGKALPDDLKRWLRLPILFYSSPDTPGSCMCPDETALAALQLLGEVSTLRTLQEGRFWVSRPIAYAS
jgi:hypothetical protein